MEKEQYKEIEDQVPAISNYKLEVRTIEEFFKEKGLSIKETTVVFWNHVITLLERVDQKEQNAMDTEDVDRMSKEAEKLTDEFVFYINEQRPFEITDFEHFLLSIYFEQLIKGEN